MIRESWRFLALAALVLAVSCAPTPSSNLEPSVARPPLNSTRVLTFLVKVEPLYLAALDISASAYTSDVISGLFHAGLVRVDQGNTPRPQLADALPALNTDTWKLFPDGRMETTYRLRPKLTWQDGSSLTAEDFAFALQVHRDPMSALLWDVQGAALANAIDGVSSPDGQTIVFTWKQPTIQAGQLLGTEKNFPPLPAHILAPVFDEEPTRLVGHPYWTTQYIGSGPYRLDRWEPGAFIEAAAFGGYALGHPKIDRVKVIWSADSNAAMANLLGGNSDVAADGSLRYSQGASLKRQWANGGGQVLFNPTTVRYVQIQFRSEFANPRAMLDVRVRRALASAMDRQAFIDGLLEGQGFTADTLVSHDAAYYPELDQVMAKYPTDLHRAEQLMNEAGLTKVSGGFYTSSAGEGFSPEVRGEQENETVILVDGWKRAGIDALLSISTPQQANDNEYRSTFPAMAITKLLLPDETVGKKFLTSLSATLENRWAGTNRGGCSNREYDRLANLFLSSLDWSERNQLMIQIAKLQTEDLPGLPLYYDLQTTAFVDSLVGPAAANALWNVEQWEWRQ